MKIQDQVIFDSLTKTAKIMRDGIYYYRASEVGDTSGSPDRIVKVNRDKREVEKALNRFKELGRLPLTINHPDQFLDLKDENSYKEGFGFDPRLVSVNSFATIDCGVSMNDEAAALYEKGIKQLSCGWEGRFVKVEDKNYEYEQEFVDFNHFAILPGGRAGSLCSIIDNNSILIDLMTINIEELKGSLLESVKSGIKDAFGAMMKKKAKKANDDDGEDEEEEVLETDDQKAEKKKAKETKDAAILDEAVKAASAIAVKDARTSLISDFSAIFEALEKGIVTVKDCSGKEPKEIKQMVVEKLLKKKVEDAEIDAHYTAALATYTNPGWKADPAKIIADAATVLKTSVNNINHFEE